MQLVSKLPSKRMNMPRYAVCAGTIPKVYLCESSLLVIKLSNLFLFLIYLLIYRAHQLRNLIPRCFL